MKKRVFSLLLCLALMLGVLPLGVFTAGAEEDIADGDYSSWDKAFIATNAADLRAVFNKQRTKGSKVYIKLGKDIDYDGPHEQMRGCLVAHDCDVHFDLCGYTLANKTDWMFICGWSGTVYIYDSQRYDSSKGQWIDGKVTMCADCRMLGERITVYGGTFINTGVSTPTKQWPAGVYGGNGLQMYGGTFEADVPIIFAKYYYGNKSDYSNCGIYGGTLRVRGSKSDGGVNAAIRIIMTQNDIDKGYMPKIERFHAVNASTKSKAMAFAIQMPDEFISTHNAIEANEYWYNFVSPSTRAYIDGELQTYGYHGVQYYNGGVYQGPQFSSDYVLTDADPVNRIEVTVPTPRAGNHNLYLADVVEGAAYEIDKRYESNYEHGGVMWYEGASVSASLVSSPFTFTTGKTYKVAVSVKLSGEYDTLAAAGKIKGIVNGQEVFVERNTDTTCTLNYTFTVEKTTVTEIPVRIPTPVSGDSITYTASVSSLVKGVQVKALNTSPFKNGVTWKRGSTTLPVSAPGTFVPSEQYTVGIIVEPTDATFYQLAPVGQIVASVNGDSAVTVTDRGDGTYLIQYKIALGMQVVSAVEATVDGINPGDPLPYEASVPITVGYAKFSINEKSSGIRNGVRWYHNGERVNPDSGAVLIPGDEYTVQVMIVSINDNQYRFNLYTTAQLNGAVAEFGIFPGSSYLYMISYTFIMPEIYVLNDFEITIPGVYAGAPLSYEATVPEGAGYAVEDYDASYWKDGVRWRQDGTLLETGGGHTYADGEQYTVAVSLVLTDEDAFRFAAADKCTATVNGVVATIEVYSETNYGIVATLTAGQRTINFVEITLPGIVAGAPLPYDASVPEGADYVLDGRTGGTWKNGVMWKQNDSYCGYYNDYTLDPGNTYQVRVSFLLADEDNGPFFDVEGEMTGTFNGQPAVVSAFDKYSCYVYYTFTMPYEIADIEVTLPGVAVGAPISYTATVPEGAGYAVEDFDANNWENGVKWYKDKTVLETNGGHTYADGEQYIVYVSLVLTDEDAFRFADADKCTATVNGVAATVTAYSETNYGISAVFTLSDYLPGDLDNNGEVNDDDAIWLLMYSFFPEDYPVTQPVDYDHNGAIDDDDAIWLLMYSFFPEDYPIV